MHSALHQHSIFVTDNIHLELLDEQHAGALLKTINANRQHLRTWLPWVDNMQTIDDCNHYISNCKNQHNEGSDYGYVIIADGVMAGRIGLHYINHQNKIAAIGYWLAENFQGKGIITKSCRAIIDYSFTVLQLNRIEIKCGVGNHKSKSIPEKLGFTNEGIMRQAEWLYDHFIDLHLYSLLKEDKRDF